MSLDRPQLYPVTLAPRAPVGSALETLRLIAEVYLTVPLALLGIVGNLVSLIVLCYHRRLQRMHAILIQLQALAIVDTLTLVVTLLLR